MIQLKPPQLVGGHGSTADAIRRLLLLGGVLCVVLIIGVGGWAATATLVPTDRI